MELEQRKSETEEDQDVGIQGFGSGIQRSQTHQPKPVRQDLQFE